MIKMTKYDYDEIFIIVTFKNGDKEEITSDRELSVTDSNINAFNILVDLMDNLIRSKMLKEIDRYEISWQRRIFDNDNDIKIMDEVIDLVEND
jgi:hypothetical protein